MLSNKQIQNVYLAALMLTTFLCIFISAGLSILFWLSFSESILFTILFVAFAIVFELAKICSLPESYTSRAVKTRIAFLAVYSSLTIISVIGSAGGLNSLLNSKQYHYQTQSARYQQLAQQINEQEHLLMVARQLADSDLQNNYRARSQQILIGEIPAIQNKLADLQNQQDNLKAEQQSAVAAAIKIIPFFDQISTSKSQAIFVGVIALLIDLISAFFISLTFLKVRECFSKQSSSDISQLNKELEEQTQTLLINEQCSSSTAKYAKIREKIAKKVYEPKVTQIMKYEKIGYKQAKMVVDEFTKMNNFMM